MINLSGKSVLVTGGSRGIGAAICRALGDAGARVLLHYGRSQAAAEALRAEIGPGLCHLIQADLAAPNGAERLWGGGAWRRAADRCPDQQCGHFSTGAGRGATRGVARGLAARVAG